jgi:hypothetical protein
VLARNPVPVVAVVLLMARLQRLAMAAMAEIPVVVEAAVALALTASLMAETVVRVVAARFGLFHMLLIRGHNAY